MRRWFLALAALMLVIGAPAAAVVEPDQVAADPLDEWMQSEGRAVVVASETSSLSAEQRTQVAIGDPVAVWAWASSYSAGRTGADPLVATAQWAAPLSLDGAAVGVLIVSVDSASTVTDHREVWNTDLGSAILAVPGASFIHDVDIDGWFRLAGDIVTPITANARGVLAGSLTVDEYQPYLVQRLQPSAAPVVDEQVQPRGVQTPVVVAAVVVFGLLAAALTSVWARRPLPEESE